MERNKAVITAGAASATLFAVTSAVSLHRVLLLPADGGAGSLPPVTGAVVEQQRSALAAPVPAVTRPSAPALTTSGASAVTGAGGGGGEHGGREGDDD